MLRNLCEIGLPSGQPVCVHFKGMKDMKDKTRRQPRWLQASFLTLFEVHDSCTVLRSHSASELLLHKSSSVRGVSTQWVRPWKRPLSLSVSTSWCVARRCASASAWSLRLSSSSASIRRFLSLTANSIDSARWFSLIASCKTCFTRSRGPSLTSLSAPIARCTIFIGSERPLPRGSTTPPN